MKTILVPTDGSAHADKALQIAAALAEKWGSSMIVLHVLMRSASFSSVYRMFAGLSLPTDDLDRALNTGSAFSLELTGPVIQSVPLKDLARLGHHILDSAQALLTGQGIDTLKLLLEDGDPAEAIIQIAERERVEAIVMGHRGLGAAKGWIAGSVATKVAHYSPCTVITVT